jgi:hypothetical protein
VNAPGYGMDQNITEAMKLWLWDSVFIHEDQNVTLTFVFKLDHSTLNRFSARVTSAMVPSK